MRIIGGTYRGRTLYGFKGEDIRPTSDNARESLFNILGDISGADFLDLFSGTGAVGIEALSRGANAFFNDVNKESVALTKENLKRLGLKAEVSSFDALSFIRSSGRKFDIIYLDPPYKSPVIAELLKCVSAILKDGGKVIFENERPFTGVAQGLVLTDVRHYGRAVLNFFYKKADGAAVYAGTFDPLTTGHYRSVADAVEAFKKVFVVVGENENKEPFFKESERVEIVKAAFKGLNVEILKFSDFKSQAEYGEYLADMGVKYYVRGIRDKKDFDYEKKAERKNSEIYPFITTAYIFCGEEYKDVSSTKIKALLKKGENALRFIPEPAQDVFVRITREKFSK